MSRIACVLLAAGLVAAPAAGAAVGYAGAAANLVEADDFSGYRFSDGSLSQVSNETEDETFRAFGGLDYSKYFAIEFGYADLGSVSFSGQSDGGSFLYAAGPVSGEIAVDGFTGAFVGKLPIGDEVNLAAHAGFIRWNAEVETRDSSGPVNASKDKGADTVYGFGAQLRIVPHVWLVMDYSLYKLNLSQATTIGAGTFGKHELKALSLGVMIPFGKNQP